MSKLLQRVLFQRKFSRLNGTQNNITQIILRHCHSDKSGKNLVTVFYDGKCGLCSKEINHYRKIAPENVFDWQDITENQAKLNKQGNLCQNQNINYIKFNRILVLGISLADGLRLLHAMDQNGKIHVGVDAFILIWSQLNNWIWLGRIVSLPIIRPIINKLYVKFADIRFKKLEHCQIAAKENK